MFARVRPVAVRANKSWLDHIWFLRDLYHTFIAELAMHLKVSAFITHERLSPSASYTYYASCPKGMAVKLWRFLGANAVCGRLV